MVANFLLERFQANKTSEAIIWNSKSYCYGELLELVESWSQWFEKIELKTGMIVSLEADFSPTSVSLLIALINKPCIVVPMSHTTANNNPDFRDIGEVEMQIKIDDKDQASHKRLDCNPKQALLLKLKNENRPGLVVFSSGTSGKNKGIVHDFVPLLQKFKIEKKSMRMISFLLFDHLGGINTLFYSLSNCGCLIVLKDRSPETVLATVEKFKVEVLPTSPTFINLLLLGRAYERFNVSSLKLVTYGTEPMPIQTLQRFNALFPAITLQQTYGTSEFGAMRTKSKSSDSLWVMLGGEDFQTRVVDGLLEIKAKSAMMGYLNAESPFTEDGWFRTGDSVELDGEYFRILGRRSELINVGGEKVYPAEIEGVLLTMPGVEEVLVQGESNPITGSMVKATIKINSNETASELRKRLWIFCSGKLADFKIPQKVVITKEEFFNERYKKVRKAQ